VHFNQLTVPISDKKRLADASIIYIHGIGGSYAVWYFNYILRFYGQFHQLAYDMRGHGESDYPMDGYDIATHAADLHTLANQADVFTHQRCFIGYSYGGCILMEYAARHATPSDKLIILDAPFAKRIDQEVIDELEELRLAMLGLLDEPVGYLATEFKAGLGDLNPKQRGISRYADRLARLLKTQFPQQSIDNPSPTPEQLAAIPCEVVFIYAAQADCLNFAEYATQHIANSRTIVLDAKHDLVSTHSDVIRDHIKQLLLS